MSKGYKCTECGKYKALKNEAICSECWLRLNSEIGL